MLLQENLLIPTASSNIIRVFEQGADGTFLYSCSSLLKHVEIRLFELATKKDTLIYEYTGSADIVNATLNPDRNVVAFTIFETKKNDSSTTEHNDVDTSKIVPSESERKKSEHLANDTSSSGANWIVKDAANDTSCENKKCSGFSMNSPSVQGKYKSYMADLYPSKWLRKFNIDRSHYQKVIFTNCCKAKEVNGKHVIENRLLLIMHKKHIALYTIYLKHAVGGKLSNVMYSSGSLLQGNVEIQDSPRAVSIVRKTLWCQWDPMHQRLFFLHWKKRRSSSESDGPLTRYSTSLCCEQFSEEQFRQVVFDCSMNFDLDEQFFVSQDSAYELLNMDPTVSSTSFNMKVLIMENGMVCICWQVISTNYYFSYNIAVVNKDIVIKYVSNEIKYDAFFNKFSFSNFGNNILVHSSNPGISVHVIAIDAITSDPHNIKRYCHYLSNIPELLNASFICQLPYPIPQNINTYVIRGSILCYVFDQATNVISAIYFDRECASNSFFNEATTLKNKIAIARFAFSEISSPTGLLRNVFLSFLEKNTMLKADKILATLLLQNAANDTYELFPEINFLRDILPDAISISNMESVEVTFETILPQIKDNMSHQISQAAEKSKYTANCWQKINYTLKHGSNFERYDLSTIDEEIHILRSDSVQPHLQEQKDKLKRRLSSVFYEILQSVDMDSENILDCFSSHQHDCMRENIMSLTFEKLCDHLKQYISDEVLFKAIAKEYITSQLRAVNHFAHLFIDALAIDEPDGGLFDPLCPEEQNLLQLLNQLFLSCSSINFPITTGFQTFFTCLTFRSCVTIHLLIDDQDEIYLDDSSASTRIDMLGQSEFLSFYKEDIEACAFDFFQKVDCKCIQLTAEFVARLIEEIPNHDIYASLIAEALQRTKHDTLVMWKQPHLTGISAKMQMKTMLSVLNQEKRDRSDSSIYGSDTSSIQPSQTGFAPYDRFLDDIRHHAENYSVDISSVEEATMQYTIQQHGKDSLVQISY